MTSDKNNNSLDEKIWNISKPAKEYPKDWYVIPAKDVIELIKKFGELDEVKLQCLKQGYKNAQDEIIEIKKELVRIIKLNEGLKVDWESLVDNVFKQIKEERE